MNTATSGFDFPEHADENRQIWDANARWWDDRIGDGNDFQTLLIEPATEQFLAVAGGDVILDIACGAGRFAQRMAELGARVVAVDCSAQFIQRARERTPAGGRIEYHVLDAAATGALRSLSVTFDKAVCTMALMDMPEVTPLFSALAGVLRPGGSVVFSVMHPCFHTAAIQRFAEMSEEETGRHVFRPGVKVSRYLSPFARKTEGILGQPAPQWYFHRPIHALFQAGFSAGFVVDGTAEPGFPAPDTRRSGIRWQDMPEIPPVMVARMRLHGASPPRRS